MNTNSNSEEKQLSEVVIDIESQNETKEIVTSKNITNELQVPLKGILRKPENQFVENIEVEKNLFRICLGLLVLVIMSPIIVCDLYFGFTDSSCSREQPDELAISLKLYLIVSGLVGLSAMITILTGITCFDPNKISDKGICFVCCGSLLIICAALFNTIWNILGAVVFWGYVYGNGNCNRTFSTYVFVSLIIKFVAALFSTQLNKKKDDKN